MRRDITRRRECELLPGLAEFGLEVADLPGQLDVLLGQLLNQVQRLQSTGW
jgi:hypothetical protein